MDVDVEKLRAGIVLLLAKEGTSIWFKDAMRGLLDIVSPEPVPEPEVPKGPYTWVHKPASAFWQIVDRTGQVIAGVYANEAAAELLASAPTLRRRLGAAEGLLRRYPTFLGACDWKTGLKKDLDRYFKDAGA